MFYLMIVFFIGFSVFIVYLLKQYFNRCSLLIEGEIDEKKKRYAVLGDEDEGLSKQNDELESRASNIFALYDITKEITHSLKKDELFSFFKDKLEEHMDFEDCRLVDSKADLEKLKGYLKFPLFAKKSIIGYLLIKGILQQDKDKFSILARQFALGLRRARLYGKIEELSITDSLTGAHTRRYCLERFAEEFQRAEKHNLRLTLLMADIDHFKRYNDKYGHLVGDVVLKEITKTIKLCIREIDLLGRFGGEEFIIIFPDTSKEGAVFVAERIRQEIEKQQIKAYDETLNGTISIGVATFPKDAVDYKELIDKADWALYRAKKMGRNRVRAFGVFR